jgi:predicted ribosome quality control (RQC) complex YloA/Tae2 family protein
MVEFVDASVLDLVRATQFLHYIKPSLRDKLIYGIEKAKPFDRSVVFHLTDRKSKGDKENTELFILSAEYILEHPIWRESENDGTT